VKNRRGFPLLAALTAGVEHGLAPVNELTMNLATRLVNNGYLKVLIVGKAFFEKMPCENAAMCNRVGIRSEFASDPVSERNTVYHIKEKFLHSRQP
jgi:hypothetical protein